MEHNPLPHAGTGVARAWLSDTADCTSPFTGCGGRTVSVTVPTLAVRAPSRLNWSVAALKDTAARLGEAAGINLPEALALISEAVWWATLADATMVRYHHDEYDQALADLDPARRKHIEGTFAGLRFVRNCMGHFVDPADFIQPQQTSLGGDAPVAAWTWRLVPAPVFDALPQRARSWEAGRYLHYRVHLASHPVGETIDRAAKFLTRILPA